jgi:hypothetical protein
LQLIRDVQTGKLNPRVAVGLAPLLSLQLRAIEKNGLEELAQLQSRVSLLETRLSRMQSASEPRSELHTADGPPVRAPIKYTPEIKDREEASHRPSEPRSDTDGPIEADHPGGVA